VRQFDPATNAYTIYTGLPTPFDAQIGPDGNLWWTGLTHQYLGRMNVATWQVTTWTLPSLEPQGLAFDGSGRVWFMDTNHPGLYRFDPSSSELCTMTLPALTPQGLYIAEHNGALWLAETYNGGVGRITPTTNAYTFWLINLLPQTQPIGVAFSPQGDVWFTYAYTGTIGRLEPSANQVRQYHPANLAYPPQLAYHAGKFWFTQDTSDGGFGFIDPAVAVGDAPHLVTPTSYTLTPHCATRPAAGTFTAPFTTGVSTFSPVALGVYSQTEGTVYTLPANSDTYGLAFTALDLWVVDYGRAKLVRVDVAPVHLYLPLARR
jgi:sugar lactone lactonase YvrE